MSTIAFKAGTIKSLLLNSGDEIHTLTSFCLNRCHTYSVSSRNFTAGGHVYNVICFCNLQLTSWTRADIAAVNVAISFESSNFTSQVVIHDGALSGIKIEKPGWNQPYDDPFQELKLTTQTKNICRCPISRSFTMENWHLQGCHEATPIEKMKKKRLWIIT